MGSKTDVLDAVVVGGGPSGLTAGFYLSRAGYRTRLIERGAIGGQTLRIPVLRNYPGFPKGISGERLVRRIERQALEYGLRIQRGEATTLAHSGGTLKISMRGAPSLRAHAVIMATGAEFLPLGLPGEENFAGRGVYHAAFAEAGHFKNKVVGVVGGGETAAHQALALARYAKSVKLFCRGGELKAIAPLRDGVRRHKRIEHRRGSTVTALVGKRALSAVEWKDSGGARRERLDALFVLVGKRPSLPELRLGGAATAERLAAKGVFIAGDARPGSARQAAVAAADGMTRAMECERWLSRRRR